MYAGNISLNCVLDDPIQTWTTADTTVASYSTYGGDHPSGNFPSTNLATPGGEWYSADPTSPRGVIITFDREVTITNFKRGYFKRNLIFVFFEEVG